ncbi:MAG: aromatic ring-hydroxylating oxygenase subunit alpha [Candidatus Binataceae bacterium]
MSKQKVRIDYDALVKADRVHSRIYTDAEIFSDEMERIFHRGWVYAGHSGEVPNPGDFRLKRIGLQPIIMVRDQSGKVNLLLNRCRHRGSTVCQESRGNARAFRCAYHGLTYRLNGDLSGVPYPDAYNDSFHRAEMGLVKVPRVEEYRGFIFGSLSPAGISLEEHLGRAIEQIDLFIDLSPESSLDVSIGAHKYNFPANWKLQVENSMDGYHPPVVHQSVVLALEERIGRQVETYTEKSQALTRDLGGGHVMLDYRRCTGNRSLNVTTTFNGAPSSAWREEYTAALERRHGKARASELLEANGTHLLVFPNLVLLGVQIRVINPVRPDLTEVEAYPTLLAGAPEEINLTRLRGHEAFFGPASAGAPDDVEMFIRMQAGYAAALDPWIVIARGENREHREADGTTVGHVMDEVTQRAIWRHWKQVMSGGEPRRAQSSRNSSESVNLSDFPRLDG